MSQDGPTTTAGQTNALPKGTRLGEFEIRRVIGAGGFGIVYMAFDHGLERDVAIKEYMPSSLASRTATLHVSLTSPNNEETFKLGLRSFVNEAKLLARFDHRSLIKVHRFWEERGTAYMVMPLLRGRTLREARRLMEHAPDEAWLRGVLEPVLGALEVLHREQVFHRDIAPDNILIGDDGVPMLLDFGAARHVIQGRSQTLTAILKPSYAPIEQYGEAANLRQGAWTDLYALGATLHYLITEAPPAPATVRAVGDDSPPLAALPRPGISEGFLRIVDWMLAPRPLDRPQSVAELREVLAGRRAIPVRPTPSPSATAWQPTELYQPQTGTAADPVPSSVPRSTPGQRTPAPGTPPPWQPPEPAPGGTLAHQEPLPMPVPTATTRRQEPARYEPTMRVEPPASARQPVPAPAPAPAQRASASAAGRGDEPLDFVASRPMPLAPPAPVGRPAGSSPRSLLPWLAGGGVAAVLGLGGWWLLQRQAAPVVPPPLAASAPLPAASVAATPAPAASAAEAGPDAAAAPPPVVTAASAPTPAPVPTPPPVAIQAPAPAPAPSPAPAPGATPRTPAVAPTAAAPTRPAPTPTPAPAAATGGRTPPSPTIAGPADTGALRPLPTRPPAPAPAPVATERRPAVPEPTLPPPRTETPAPRQIESAQSPRDPREACGSRVLLALHLCLVRQCVKPVYHDHPECVEVRAIEERTRNRNMTQ